MRRLLVSCAVVAVALLAQLTFINRLALPGETGPDLVLLAVVALALTGGPLPGMLTGFLAGLALDVAPPASHTIGQYALVFCLVGYGCGRLAGLGDASPALYVGISAAAAAAGAALHAGLGVLLSDPEVTWAAVRHVLPPSLIYDVILSPFVLYAVVRLNGWAGRSAPGESAASASAPASWTAAAAGVTARAVRQASTSGSPRLHLADHRGRNAWIGSARTADGTRLASPTSLRPGTREPKLRFKGLRRAGAGPTPGGLSNGTAGARYAGSKSAPKMNFSGGRSGGTAGARYRGLEVRAEDELQWGSLRWNCRGAVRGLEVRAEDELQWGSLRWNCRGAVRGLEVRAEDELQWGSLRWNCRGAVRGLEVRAEDELQWGSLRWNCRGAVRGLEVRAEDELQFCWAP